jgi:hypothetical protein
MADISNKTLAILVGIAIVVSVVGILSLGKPSVLYVTGRGTTDGGNVSVNLTSELSILVTNNINFGNGRVAAGSPNATLESSGVAAVGGSWATITQYITVENDGTVNASVNVSADSGINTWLGGTGAINDMQIKGHATESNACPSLVTTYQSIQDINADVTICPLLKYGKVEDSFNTSIKLVVPSDATMGSKKVSLTYSAKLA